MITTAFRSASASLNCAAEHVVGAACAASTVFRQAQSIVHRAEGELSAEAAAATRQKAAAEAEQDEYTAEDQTELNEIKRKQAEEEEKAQTQQAAENAASEALQQEKERREDEAAVEAELDEVGCEEGVRREALRQSKLDCRKTDRELGNLKGKIQQLQVQLRLQHVKNLQTANGETRRLQNRLQSQYLTACQPKGPISAPTEPVKSAKSAAAQPVTPPALSPKPKAEVGYQQELENLRRSFSAENNENRKSSSSPAGPTTSSSTKSPRVPESLPRPAPATPSQALLTLLADFVDTSLSDLRLDSSTYATSAQEMLACAMKHLGWLMALHPTISSGLSAGNEEDEEEDVAPAAKTKLVVPFTPLALPPDGRSKALWLAALLAPDDIPSLTTELRGKLAFLDATCAELGEEAKKLFDQKISSNANVNGTGNAENALFSELFCARINSGVTSARTALRSV
jgi:hypothetical protein